MSEVDEADLAEGPTRPKWPLSGADAQAVFNTPANIWDCKLSDCTPDALLAVGNYLKHQTEFVRQGLGYWFSGQAGVGKTTAAIQLAKAGLRRFEERELDETGELKPLKLDARGKEIPAKLLNEGWYGHLTDRSIYFTRASDLRDAVRFHREFGDCGLVETLIRRAKVLIIDDIDPTDFSDSFFNWKSLVIDRAAAKRPTFFTSILTFVELGAIQLAWHEQVGRVLYEIPITGDNRRVAEMKSNRTKIFEKGSP